MVKKSRVRVFLGLPPPCAQVVAIPDLRHGHGSSRQAPTSVTPPASAQNTSTGKRGTTLPSRNETEKMPRLSRLAWYELMVPR